MSDFVVDLVGEKKRIAEEAKKAASEIVQDAIDKQCYGFPVSFYYTCSEPIDSYTFCCIPTKEFLQELLAKLNGVSFKEDTDPEEMETFAYVIPNDKDNIVYLCKKFWSAPDILHIDSKPGTLIHEVSHLLGTIDVSYEHLTVELYEDYGTLLGKSQCIKDVNGKDYHREEVFQVNANCLEHEFETIINHEQVYSNERYQCCGETKKNSVCKRRSTGHYYLHQRFEQQRAEMENKLAKFWEGRNDHATTEGKRGFLQALLAKLDEVSFKENTDAEEREAFAYVIPNDKDNIVYLCKKFWSAPDILRIDSKPGTLIHEVSHLLGTTDITYEHLTVELYEQYGTLLGRSQSFEDEDGKVHYREE
ncbi:hypothetical protein MHYP_G00177420 [Metynnis hypsauchen]